MFLTIKNEGSICLESKQTIILDPKEKVALQRAMFTCLRIYRLIFCGS